MFMGVKSNLKLIFSYFKLNLKKEWKYKSSFFMQIAMMILNDLFFIIQWYNEFTKNGRQIRLTEKRDLCYRLF